MRTSGEKLRISDEAERVQSVSHPHIRSLAGIYISIYMYIYIYIYIAYSVIVSNAT